MVVHPFVSAILCAPVWRAYGFGGKLSAISTWVRRSTVQPTFRTKRELVKTRSAAVLCPAPQGIVSRVNPFGPPDLAGRGAQDRRATSFSRGRDSHRSYGDRRFR